MGSEPLGWTRGFSLRAPTATEEERALLQRRLALTSLLVFLLAAGFWLITTLSLALLAPGHAHHMWTTRTAWLQLATTFVGLAFWGYTRSGVRSALALDALDVASAVLLCLGWATMTVFEPAHVRPELIGLLACTYTLVMRAALIPSPPARTALLGSVALSPLIAVTFLRPVVTPDKLGGPLGHGVYVAIWALLGVAATTVSSWIIYGLRLQVRKAMQLGQYLLEEKIGEGGMGVVYRASHAMLRRPTAIKLLSESTGQAIERFEREVQITARLTHPNTVAIFDYGRTPDGLFYYAMEYLDGVSLEELVAATGPQPPARVVHVLLQVCGALREAHSEGLVHRDIKPANLMLTARGYLRDFVKVLDFGLVKETVAPTSAAVTHASAILGTPHYMAPESIVDPSSVDGRADIYALGATAFFMLTGARAFDGRNLVEVCSRHLHEPPEAPSSRQPGIPASLDAIILSCLAKSPTERPKDAAALAELLQGAGVASWTHDDAFAWWEQHGPELGALRRASAPSTSALGQTIAVAPEGRVRAPEAV